MKRAGRFRRAACCGKCLRYILFPVGYPAADAEVPDLQRKTLSEVTVEIPAPQP